MKRGVLVTSCLTTLLAAVAASAAPSPAAEAWDGRARVVHEWGTFVSVQGSDGVVLDGLVHEDTDLPRFVHDLRDVAGVTGVSPKMETPVVYLYSPDERRVSVRVRFPRGTITQWYPAASSVNHHGVSPDGRLTAPPNPAIAEHRDGFVVWGGRRDLRVLAPGAAAPLPLVAAGDPWRFSREVDANALRVCNLNATIASGRPEHLVYEHERFLFYRGLGDFPLPLTGRVAHEEAGAERYRARLRLESGAAAPLRHVFLIWVRDGRAGFRYLPTLDGAASLEVDLALAPAGEVTAALVDAVAARLTETGLYRKEALAMARTWRHAWFGDDGLRVLYVLSPAWVERELPLEVTGMGAPGSYELVRTFVGRTELLSPAREQALVDAVAASARGEAVGQRTVERWGRFGLPFLRRVLALSADPAVRAEAERLRAVLAVAR